MPLLPLAAISLTEVEITRFFVAIVALMGMAETAPAPPVRTKELVR